MEDDRRSQLTGFSGSLLLHALIVVPFLLLMPLGNKPEQRKGRKDQAIVVTLLPLDGSAVSVASSRPAHPKYEDTPSEAPSTVVGKATPVSDPANLSFPVDPQREQGRAEGQASPVPANEDVRFYQRALLAHIERYQGYPQEERNRRIEGIVLVRFAMTRQGSILDAWVDRSSGVMALDDEALATVHRAQPLPMIPAGLPDRLNIVLPVSFSLR